MRFIVNVHLYQLYISLLEVHLQTLVNFRQQWFYKLAAMTSRRRHVDHGVFSLLKAFFSCRCIYSLQASLVYGKVLLF